MPSRPMITPTRRLAAPVTMRPSAPIAWSSLGNERQSTEPGDATVLVAATAQPPVKSSASVTVPGNWPAAAPIRANALSPAGSGRGSIDMTGAVQRNQLRRLRIAALEDARAVSAGIQPIDQPCEQHRTGAVDTLDARQVHVDRTTGLEVRERAVQDLRHGRGVAQIERACRHRRVRSPSASIRMSTDCCSRRARIVLAAAFASLRLSAMRNRQRRPVGEAMSVEWY